MAGYRFEGQVQAVLIGIDAQSLVTTAQAEVMVSMEGFLGDKHSGFTRGADGRTPYYTRGTLIRNDRQATILSKEDLEEVAASMGLPEIKPEWLGANLLLSGIPRLSLLPPRTRLIFAQGAVLRVEEENNPCIGPGEVIAAHYRAEQLASRFVKAALHRRGVVATVELPGKIAIGDAVLVETPVQTVYQPE